MPQCNSCSKEIDADSIVCDDCFRYASQGAYAICVKCDKISFAYIDIEGITRKRIYSKTCLHCSGKIPDYFYELEEEAKKE